MSQTTDLITTENRGKSDGTRFSDSPPFGDIATSTVTKIFLRKNAHCIFSLTVYYSWNNGLGITHGYATSDSAGVSQDIEFTLGPDEFITSIEGHADAFWVYQLTFVTTKGIIATILSSVQWIKALRVPARVDRHGPYGPTTGESFVWPPSGAGCGLSLLAFAGSADEYMQGIQATFGQPPKNQATCMNQLKTALYESMAIAAPTIDALSTIGASITRSKYSRYARSAPVPEVRGDLICGARSHLMSPIATLCVGQERVQFHAHEDTLCKLPFFKAALQGLFKEASEKAISMPEDDPSHVSALIEFLYTGNYTYTYDPTSITLPDGSTTPVGDLTEGLYHVGVYLVASKYDCTVLSEMAVKNVEAVAIELDNINALRLWKAAYAEGLRLSRCRQDFKHYSSGEGLVAWVKGLFREYEEEMDETFGECPQLATDLLRIATGDE